MISLKKFLDELAGKDHPMIQGICEISGEIQPLEETRGEKGGGMTPAEKQLPIRFMRGNNN